MKLGLVEKLFLTMWCWLLRVRVVTGVFPRLLNGLSTTGTGSGSATGSGSGSGSGTAVTSEKTHTLLLEGHKANCYLHLLTSLPIIFQGWAHIFYFHSFPSISFHSFQYSEGTCSTNHASPSTTVLIILRVGHRDKQQVVLIFHLGAIKHTRRRGSNQMT